MFEYVALSDGTTLLDLTDTTSYALVSYAPGVAPLRDNELGGDGPYADVQDTITFHAIGCTAAEAYQAVAAVDRMLDNARRWRREEYTSGTQGATVPAVQLLIRAQQSSLATLTTAIKGRAPGGPSNIALGAQWNAHINRYVIQNVTIQFVRRAGLFLAPESTSASGAAANPSVHSLTFASSRAQHGPLSLAISSFTGPTMPIARAGFVAVGSNSTDITIAEAETGASGAPWTSVADAANLARNGSVLRYTPAGTSPSTCGPISGFTLLLKSGPVAIIAAVRNNSGTTTFQLRADITQLNTVVTSTPYAAIDVSTTNPRLIVLGPVVVRLLSGVTLTAIASAASGSLDIDYIAVVSLRDDTCRIVALQDTTLNGNTFTLNLEFDPRDDQKPAAPFRTLTGSPIFASYAGDLALQTVGTDVAAAWFATNSNYWRFTDTTPAVVSVSMQATRYPTYLVPE